MAGDYSVLTDIEQLAKMADGLLESGQYVGFDVETGYSGPDAAKRATDHWHPDQFTVGFSISGSPSWARYVPLRHDNPELNVASVKDAWEAVTPLLTKGKIVAHNAKFEAHSVKKSAGIELCAEGHLEDTMLDAYILNEWQSGNYRTMVALKDLVLAVLGHQMTHIEELFPDKPKNWFSKLRFNILDLTPQVVAYACEDAAWVLALRNSLGPKAESQRKFMQGLEHKILQIMADVENYGVNIDWEGMQEAYAQAQSFVPNMEQAVKKGLGELAGGRDLSDLNLGSPQQMKKLLYSDIGLSTTRQTKGAETKAELEEWQKMSTDAKALKALSDEHPAVKKLLELREVQNLNKRLKKWLTEFSTAADGKVHPNYNQVQVGTGRFSANDPPIQQCPKEWRWTTALGYDPFKKETAHISEKILETQTNGVKYWQGNFRDFIISSPGTYLLTYDYSQIELRVLAGESQEPALLQAFASGTDVHSATAAQMLGKRVEDLNPDTERPIGKTMNFALLYGMGPKSLSEQLGVSMDRAKELYQQYFSAFSRIASWMEKMQQVGAERGYAETRFGRRYRVWELDADKNTQSGRAIEAKGRRVLINAPIQGAAADYMKIAMVRVHAELKRRGWWGTKVTIIMNQHDSLTFECTNDMDPQEVKNVIERCVVFGEEQVPLVKGFPEIVADWELGHRWGSSAKWKSGMVPAWLGDHWELRGTGFVPEEKFEEENFDPDEETLPELPAVLPTPATIDRISDEAPTLVIETLKMPTEARLQGFLKLLQDSPGETAVVLKTPEGELALGASTSLDMSSQGLVSLTLGGATMRVRRPESMVGRDLSTGLRF